MRGEETDNPWPGEGQGFSVDLEGVFLQLADCHGGKGAPRTLVGMLTRMSFEDVCLQPAVVGGLKGAKLASEWFMVSVVGLHMAIQIVPESRDKGAILAAVLVLAGEHGQGQMAPLVRTQPLHGGGHSGDTAVLDVLAEVVADGSERRMHFHTEFTLVAHHLPLLDLWHLF